MKILLAFGFLNFALVYGLLSEIPTWNQEISEFERLTGRYGSPLYLTELLDDPNRNLTSIQEQAFVKHEELQDLISYSGYFTVNKEFNSNMFFWYFEAAEDPENAPVVIFLQGGPGSSSMIGLFTINGPLQIINSSIEMRKISWQLKSNIVFIDNPVGTGFSFTENDQGYAKNQYDVGRDMVQCLTQFFTLFPNLRDNDFFVTGESYGGKYVPAVSYAIHQNNLKPDSLKINLKGLAVGNGWTDPINQLVYSDFLFQVGLIDKETSRNVRSKERECRKLIDKKLMTDAWMCWNQLINGFMKFVGFPHYYNYIDSAPYTYGEDLDKLFRRSDIREAMHVGTNTFSGGGAVYNNLLEDFMDTAAAPFLPLLLDNYKVYYYTGHLDIVVPFTATDNFLQKLRFSSMFEFRRAERHQWKFEGEIAGYVKTAGNLTQIMVRNSGHMVPKDQPEWGLDMLARIVENRDFF